MLDPWTALGLAGNIVQFVDFGSKLVIEGHRTYRSAAGLSEESIEIQGLADDLDTLSANIAVFADARSKGASPEDVALVKIAQTCHGVARDLSNIISALRLKSKGPLRSWDAVRQTVRKAIKKEKIEALQKQLDTLKLQMNTHLLRAIQSEQSTIAKAVDSLVRKSETLQLQQDVSLAGLRRDILAHIDASTTNHDAIRNSKRRDNAYFSAIRSCEASTHGLIDALNAMRDEGGAMTKKNAILDSLRYPEMPDRHHEIREAHPQTFEWIFENERTPFKTWLETDSGIFWISGKAGSGKSTLMKFLDDHTRTRQMLDSWAARQGKTLLLSSYYFWSAGYPMQRKQEGLLQSLLFQILRRVPRIIQAVFPERWAKGDLFHRHPDPWTRKELSSALHAIVNMDESHTSTKFCFFIDGLDEYEGDPTDIIADLDWLAQSKTVKLCVSSRPWTEFRDAYGGSLENMITLQDLTRSDMDSFVRGMLGENGLFVKLERREPSAQRLITEILDKAQGVFLWVFLVVRSLLRGLGKNDDISTLEERLKELPSDLENYFALIMNNIERVYQDRAARLFQLAVCETPLPLLTIDYLTDPRPGLERAVSCPIQPIIPQRAREIAKTAFDRLNAWCRDLMELYKPSEAYEGDDFLSRCEIKYLHRTVRDFMLTSDMQKWLKSHIKAEFDPRSTLLQIHVIQAKGLNLGFRVSDDVQRFGREAAKIMRWAHEYEEHYQRTPSELIEEVDRIGNHIWPSEETKPESHWTSEVFPSPSNFLAFTVSHGLTLYVRTVLDRDPQLMFTKLSHPLLDFALRTDMPGQVFQPGWDARYAVTELLLERGADPNKPDTTDEENDTPWARFLCRCYQEGEPRLWNFARLLIRHRARCDIDVVVEDVVQDQSRDSVISYIECGPEGESLGDLRSVTQCLGSCSPLSEEAIREIISRDGAKQSHPSSRPWTGFSFLKPWFKARGG